MKKILALFLTVILISACAVPLSACTKLTDEELKIVGKYELTQISGIDDVTPASYSYNYIEITNDKKFEIKNESGGVLYNTTGKWSLSGNTLTFKLSGLFAKKETHTYQNGTITVKGEIKDRPVTMVFTKAAA